MTIRFCTSAVNAIDFLKSNIFANYMNVYIKKNMNINKNRSLVIYAQKDINIKQLYTSICCIIRVKVSAYCKFLNFINETLWTNPYCNFTLTENHLCSECGKSFHTAQYLRVHSIKHGAEKKHQCSDCPASFKSRQLLKIHITRHQNLQFKCNDCSAVFTSKPSLIKHESKKIHFNQIFDF